MKDIVKKQVDEIVSAIDGGKKADDFANAAAKDPYVFIMEENGNLLVHPTLAGESLKEKAEPVYNEVVKGTAGGDYVKYEWAGAKKVTYSRKTAGGLFVGSGYNEE
ncbi:MAG: cache domain-containing protein [Desulfococcaceae bacterium]|jgi:signal transduction histidine kinase|nr:cache domain-containing protein [Desulfococcaceae bacterium]